MQPVNDRDDDPRFWARYPHPNLAKYLTEDAVGETFRSVAWPTWGLVYGLVRTVLRHDEPNYVLEFGVDQGLTGIVMNQACIESSARYGYFGYDRETSRVASRRFLECGIAAGEARFFQVDLPDVELPTEDVVFSFVDFSKGFEENKLVLCKVRDSTVKGGLTLVDNVWCKGVAAAVADVAADAEANVVWLPRASWGFWPQRERGGTPGMALIQWKGAW